MSRRRKLILVLAAIALVAALLVPLPLAVTDTDRERAVSHAIRAVIQNRRALTSRGYARLYDCDSAKDKGRLYFRNELGIPDAVFSARGLKPAPADMPPNLGGGEVIFGFGSRDMEGNPTDDIQFYYPELPEPAKTPLRVWHWKGADPDPEQYEQAQQLIAAERQADNKIVVPDELVDPHPLVARAEKILRKTRPSKRGRLIPKAEDVLAISVTKSSLDRALRIMDALIKALDRELPHRPPVQGGNVHWVRGGRQFRREGSVRSSPSS